MNKKLEPIWPKIKELKVKGLKWKGVGIRRELLVLIRDLTEKEYWTKSIWLKLDNLKRKVISFWKLWIEPSSSSWT